MVAKGWHRSERLRPRALAAVASASNEARDDEHRRLGGRSRCQPERQSADRQTQPELQNKASYTGCFPMTSLRQIAANRRNASKSTGPTTDEGKQARCNAVRHGLTAETVIGGIVEDAEDYKAFEAAITTDYEAQSAVERELVLRLASLLWRLRRATTMETGLFEIRADHLSQISNERRVAPESRQIVYAIFGQSYSAYADNDASLSVTAGEPETPPRSDRIPAAHGVIHPSTPRAAFCA
jgi:hypothetical protein